MPTHAAPNPAKPRTRTPRRLPIPQLVIAAGLILCLYPFISDLVTRYTARQTVSTISGFASALDDETRSQALAQAEAYNARLGNYTPTTEAAQQILATDTLLPYVQQLQTTTDAMGSLTIPRAGILLPIYHGDDDIALAQGVGHQDTTSLPIGGARSSVWLEGHSGLRTSSLFDTVRVLEPGDVIGVNVLGHNYAWRVTSWEIVDPATIDPAAFAPTNSDTLTLVTCTTTPDQWNPKGRTGVNDKRLLVHATRCEYDPAEFAQAEAQAATDPAIWANEHTMQAIYALAVALVAIIALLIRRRAKKATAQHTNS